MDTGLGPWPLGALQRSSAEDTWWLCLAYAAPNSPIGFAQSHDAGCMLPAAVHWSHQKQVGLHIDSCDFFVQDNGTIIAEDRPYYQTKQLNWDDHACATYKDAVFNVTHVSAPEWVTGIAPQ